MHITKELSFVKIEEVQNLENVSKETQQFHFFKIPKQLIKNKQFKNLSNDAKYIIQSYA